MHFVIVIHVIQYILSKKTNEGEIQNNRSLANKIRSIWPTILVLTYNGPVASVCDPLYKY